MDVSWARGKADTKFVSLSRPRVKENGDMIEDKAPTVRRLKHKEGGDILYEAQRVHIISIIIKQDSARATLHMIQSW